MWSVKWSSRESAASGFQIFYLCIIFFCKKPRKSISIKNLGIRRVPDPSLTVWQKANPCHLLFWPEFWSEFFKDSAAICFCRQEKFTSFTYLCQQKRCHHYYFRIPCYLIKYAMAVTEPQNWSNLRPKNKIPSLFWLNSNYKVSWSYHLSVKCFSQLSSESNESCEKHSTQRW